MCPCQVCTEARDATKNAKQRVQKPKLVPAKRARKRVRGALEGRRTSRFAGIYIYRVISIEIYNLEHMDVSLNGGNPKTPQISQNDHF